MRWKSVSLRGIGAPVHPFVDRNLPRVEGVAKPALLGDAVQVHVAGLVAAQPQPDQVQPELVLAEHHQVRQVVVAAAEAVAVAPVDALDHRQPGLEHALVVAGLVRPDLLPHRAVSSAPGCRSGVVKSCAWFSKNALTRVSDLRVDVRLHAVRHARHHAPARAEPHEGRHHQPLLVLHRCVRHMPCAFHLAMFSSQVSGSLTGA